MSGIRERALVVVAALMLAAGCAAHRPPPAAGTAAPTEAKATLELLGVEPASGAQVSRDSVIVAKLAYTIAGFDGGDFFLMAQVETTDPRRTTDGAFPSQAYPVLKDPTGRLTFSFPLRYVWDRSDVKRPFRLWFNLNQKTGPSVSRVIGRAGPLDYGSR